MKKLLKFYIDNSKIKIIFKKNIFYVFLNFKIFFIQDILYTNFLKKNSFMGFFFFLMKILYHFGLFNFKKPIKILKKF